MAEWRDKRVLIIGAARQGTALARYLASKGARVILNDRRTPEELGSARASLSDLSGSIEWVLGEHPLAILDSADLICPSGGVPLSLPLIVEALRRGIPLSNDSQIFMEEAPCMVVGITGSAGKTTTTTLAGRMAQAAVTSSGLGFHPERAWVGGNIGSPLISVVDQMGSSDLAVMELSSFQLELMTVSPQVASILNITPNHLDRHDSMQSYTAAKARILGYQGNGDSAVLGRDDPGAWGLSSAVKGKLYSFGLSPLPEGSEGVYLDDGHVMLRVDNKPIEIMERSHVGLRGEHNLQNTLAACAVCAAAGLPVDAMIAGVEGFTGVSHRLEFVREWKGASWYNDSIATAPERSMAAIRSFDERLVLLAGGRDKNLPWDEFAQLVCRRVGHLVLFGEAAGKILSAVERACEAGGAKQPAITKCSGLRQAVVSAAEACAPGDVVLLSPGGTSFDEFRDFEERGEAYRKWVMMLD
ncbi:MAG: UDP-N-acetylmuramoyl-L-alanine--D-glutamate ligase [Chloroflexi bacterium]|nr:MAG: UDP-N-acetylmuramoyl-L-alanine--D-glutamate ligase [Chloroflexota bacterium]